MLRAAAPIPQLEQRAPLQQVRTLLSRQWMMTRQRARWSMGRLGLTRLLAQPLPASLLDCWQKHSFLIRFHLAPLQVAFLLLAPLVLLLNHC